MRQAGRYQSQYRQIREKVDFLTLCKTPELASQVTVMAVEQLSVDAAIIFADILLPIESLGLGLSFEKGEGPVIERPICSSADIEALPLLESAESLSFVFDAIKMTCRELSDRTPLIGFAGAPFTVASYAIEGGSSRSFEKTKQLMWSEPEAWSMLMEKIVVFTAAYLKGQIKAGASALQLFDSWVGCLSLVDYDRFVAPHVRRLIDITGSEVPLIYFSTSTAGLNESIKTLGADVIGIDWRMGLDQAWSQVGYDHAIQGNLDPLVLLSDKDEIRRQVKDILQRAGGRPGHVFNLGHGILPQTPVENARYLVELVRELS